MRQSWNWRENDQKCVYFFISFNLIILIHHDLDFILKLYYNIMSFYVIIVSF